MGACAQERCGMPNKPDWRLRTGDSAEPLRKHRTNQYKGSANLQSTLNTLAHSLAKPAYSNQKSGATGGNQRSKVGHVDGKIREALGEHGTWLTLMYLHKALGHVSNPKRLRHTLLRAIGPADPGPLSQLPCEDCWALLSTAELSSQIRIR